MTNPTQPTTTSPPTRTADGRPPGTTLAHRPLTPLLALLLALLGAVSACTPDRTDPPMKTYADLTARPRLEDITARYDQMQQRIRDRIETELSGSVGLLGWRQIRDGSRSTCGYDVPVEFGGRTLFMAPWGFGHSIPDAQWARVTQIVTDIIGEYGFIPAGLSIDKPGHHVFNAVDTTLGASYDLGSQVATSMQVSTGCHLPRSAPR
jgi:predicted LppA-like lipoprotein